MNLLSKMDVIYDHILDINYDINDHITVIAFLMRIFIYTQEMMKY